MTSLKKAWINFIVLLVTMAISAAAAFGWLSGNAFWTIFTRYPSLLLPLPTFFRIWAVICLLLIVCLTVLLLNREKPYYQKILNRVSLLFWLSCIFCLCWTLLFTFLKIDWSCLFILLQTIFVFWICFRLLRLRRGKFGLLQMTFALYSGWLIPTAVLTAAVWLGQLQWDGFGMSKEFWASAVLILMILLIIGLVQLTKNALVPLGTAWAYLGIYLRHISVDGLNRQYHILPILALVGMVVLIGLAAIEFYRNHFGVLPAVEKEAQADTPVTAPSSNEAIPSQTSGAAIPFNAPEQNPAAPQNAVPAQNSTAAQNATGQEDASRESAQPEPSAVLPNSGSGSGFDSSSESPNKP